MTYREATRIAYQERGVPDEVIDRLFSEADSEYPMAGRATQQAIPAGTERAFIERIKKLGDVPTSQLEAKKEELDEHFKEQNAKN